MPKYKKSIVQAILIKSLIKSTFKKLIKNEFEPIYLEIKKNKINFCFFFKLNFTKSFYF